MCSAHGFHRSLAIISPSPPFHAGEVTPVKEQGKSCDSSVAFATMAVIETCFYRATGRYGDYSEQELIDCAAAGDQVEGANGECEPTDGLTPYLVWAVETQLQPASEEQYPYRYSQPIKSASACPADLGRAADLAARPVDYFSTGHGSEALLKVLVVEHGAVMAAVQTNVAFGAYRGGIFADCDDKEGEVDHAVTVVGYGREKGMDYWLIKNSWGVDWGEDGYMRLQRGVGMCGIGRYLAGILCERASFDDDNEVEIEEEEEIEEDGDDPEDY